MRIKQHERLRIWRERAGLNQLQAADRLGLTYREYLALEKGRAPATRLRISLPRAGSLSRGEECLIMRLRAGKTQAQVAAEIGCCRRWVMLMERGEAPADTLVWYWEH